MDLNPKQTARYLIVEVTFGEDGCLIQRVKLAAYCLHFGGHVTNCLLINQSDD